MDQAIVQYCESCGKPLNAEARFCGRCGKPISPAAPAPVPPLPPAYAPP